MAERTVFDDRLVRYYLEQGGGEIMQIFVPGRSLLRHALRDTGCPRHLRLGKKQEEGLAAL